MSRKPADGSIHAYADAGRKDDARPSKIYFDLAAACLIVIDAGIAEPRN
jgi:hypothetical protein